MLYTAKNEQLVAILLRTGLNNVLLPALSLLSTIMFSIVTPESGSTALFHIVDNCEKCGQTDKAEKTEKWLRRER